MLPPFLSGNSLRKCDERIRFSDFVADLHGAGLLCYTTNRYVLYNSGLMKKRLSSLFPKAAKLQICIEQKLSNNLLTIG